MKKNRQIGLDGRVFICDCLSNGIFFIYSIILCGFLSAAGDVMKLLGTSGRGMNELTNGVIVLDLICSLGMVVVAYYVYFMNCGESVPKLGTKPLIYLEYARLAYYGLLVYFVLYRLIDACRSDGKYPAALPIFYVFYLAWLIACVFAAMFLLTLLHQNVIRRSYERSFKILALAGLAINIMLPLVYIITRIWIKGWGDGFYSAGLCDFVRLCAAPVFYSAIWFLYMNAIDRVHRVFDEVDNAIRDKRYHIEFDDDEEKAEKESKPLINLKSGDNKEKHADVKKGRVKKEKKSKKIKKSESNDKAAVSQTASNGKNTESETETAVDGHSDEINQ
ncbi:MAG: hypothetical protein ACI4IJ_00865 [Acutalibacteraceae bacterium]